MPRYRVTVIDTVTLIELDGVVTTRRFWWLGVVDGLIMQGRREFVISLRGARLRTFADARFVGAVADRILGSGGRVVFVPPPGRRASARVHSVARTHRAMAAASVESAMAAISVAPNG